MRKDKKIRQSFEKIYSKTAKYIYGLAVKDTNSLDDAEDIVQETYVALLDELEKGREISNPKSYLTTILRRKLSEYFKRQKPRESNSLSDIVLGYDFEDHDIDDPEIDERLVTEELIDELAELLRDKDETVRRLFYLRFVLEMTYPEIAVKTDLSLSTVKSKVYRTLKQLRKHYTEV